MNQFIMVDFFKEGITLWILMSWLCQDPGDLALNCFSKEAHNDNIVKPLTLASTAESLT